MTINYHRPSLRWRGLARSKLSALGERFLRGLVVPLFLGIGAALAQPSSGLIPPPRDAPGGPFSTQEPNQAVQTPNSCRGRGCGNSQPSPPAPARTCHQLWLWPAFQSGRVEKTFCGVNSGEECRRARGKYGNITECKQTASAQPTPVPPPSPSTACYVLRSHSGPGSLATDWGTFCEPNASHRCWDAANRKNAEMGGMPIRFGCTPKT